MQLPAAQLERGRGYGNENADYQAFYIQFIFNQTVLNIVWHGDNGIPLRRLVAENA